MIKDLFIFLFTVVLLLQSCDSNTSIGIGGTKSQFYNKTGHLPNVPVRIEFCDEQVNFLEDDLKERLDAEIIFAQNDISASTLLLKRTKRFFPLMDSVLRANDMPLDLKYIAACESGLNPNEFRSGSAGIWQLKETMALEMGLQVNEFIDERFDVVKSTQAVCDFFRKAYSSFIDWPTRIIALNRGVSNVQIALRNQQTDTYFDTQFSAETSRYVFRVISLMLLVESPDDYGFKLTDYDYYYPYKSRKVTVDGKVGNLKHWAKEQGINYKIVRILNPWILKEVLPSGKNFELRIPNDLSNLKPYGKNEDGRS